MLDHINLLRHLVFVFGGLLMLWFWVMFLWFWVSELRKVRRR
jgi:hypothetical protein